jgi:hypothetical protein
MSTISQFIEAMISTAIGQVVIGIFALGLFFLMADSAVSAATQEQVQSNKGGYQMCMKYHAQNAAYCGMVFPKYQ